jgi:Anti-sigma-28 factor, FlgM
VLEIYRWIVKSGPHDVRWEKVELIKRILTDGAYSVPQKQVAAKLIEQMLERGRGNHCCERRRSGGTTNDSSGFALQAETP